MSTVLGTDGFKHWVKTLLSKKADQDYELPEAKAIRIRPGADEVLEVVREVYEVDREMLRRVRRGQWNEPRDVAIYLCRKECGLTLREIANVFRIPVYTTVSMACGRVEGMLKNDQAFQQRVERLLKKLRGQKTQASLGGRK
jgi:chromosomal replication initiation ATPase DnaA